MKERIKGPDHGRSKAVITLEEHHARILRKGEELRASLQMRPGRFATKRLGREAVGFRSEFLDAHLKTERHIILDLLKEHLGDVHEPHLEKEARLREELQAEADRVERDLDSRKDCTEDLRVLADKMCEYAAQEQRFLKWGAEKLGPVVLREADARLEAETRLEQPDVALPDLATLAR